MGRHSDSQKVMHISPCKFHRWTQKGGRVSSLKKGRSKPHFPGQFYGALSVQLGTVVRQCGFAISGFTLNVAS